MLDELTIQVSGGNGGRGAISFRREKYVRSGGPDGGFGGKGGGVYLKCVDWAYDLSYISSSSYYNAENGSNGGGRNFSGGDGMDLEIPVPSGTTAFVRDQGLGVVLDVTKAGECIVVARGGSGGRGNKSFATATIQTPRIAEAGQKGERRMVRLDYKVVSDVAIIGLPNGGKTTLLNRLSNARAKVADYPMTTVDPITGAVEYKWRQYAFVEIPATWSGGDTKVLKHAERARALLVCLDSSASTILSDYKTIDEALKSYGKGLESKPRVIALTKADLVSEDVATEELFEDVDARPYSVNMMSAETNQAITPMLDSVIQVVEELAAASVPSSQPEAAAHRPVPRTPAPAIERKGDAFIVRSEQIERLVAGTDLEDWEARAQLAVFMERAGVQQALEKAGVKRGDTVVIGGKEMEWI